jgi:hypothetical protein
LAIFVVVVVGLAVRIALRHAHSHVLLGVLVILFACCGFYTTLRLDQNRLEKQRYTRGPGWILGVTISKLPLGAARLVWLAISIAILALGIAELAG